MSFFNEVLGSIGTGKSPAPPKPVPKPTPANPTKPAAEATNLVSRPATSSSLPSDNGRKRKAEGDLTGGPEKAIKPYSKPESSSISNASSNDKRSTLTPGDAKAQAATPKMPPKGSYADIMARARLAQEQKGQNHVGVIMHQAASKEKGSKMATKRRDGPEKAPNRK